MEDPIQAEIVLYQSEGANVPVQVYYKDETLWVSQAAMADLFDVSVSTISEHLINIFASGELQKASSTSFSGFSGKTSSKGGRPKTYYNLDAVIAVGYRVNSMRATRFRQWATATLKEYITKGFVLNDDMLKNGRPFGKDYFDELLARIRDIRASERRAWLKITDIFQECSFDYDKDSTMAKNFYAAVQNKMHYAVTGHTAAEIVQGRSDPSKPNMGLTSWKGGPEGRIHSSDVTVAKNYLSEDEIRQLNRLVTMLLDTLEDRAERHVLTSMEDCERLLDGFLTFSGREVLKGPGNRNKKTADKIAKERFHEFQKLQDKTYENDFELMVKHMNEKA